MKTDIEALRARLPLLEDDAARQYATVQAFGAAREADDEALMMDIARLVIGDSGGDEAYSRGWQMFCLQGLTEICAGRFVQAENDEEREQHWYSLADCLWKFKWIIQKLPQDPDISRQEMEDYNRMMGEYYDWVDFSPAAVHKTIMLQSMYCGDVDTAKAHFAKWQAAQADESGDCPACEQTELVNYHHFIGAYRKAADYAEPILRGEMHCAEVPQITYYPAIESFIEIGKWTEAAACLERALADIESDMERFIGLLCPLLQSALRLGESARVHALLDKYYAALARYFSNKPFAYLDYLMVAAAFDEDAYQRACQFADDFDARNGNHYYRSRLNTLMQRPQTQ